MSKYKCGDRVRSVLNDDEGGDPSTGIVIGEVTAPRGFEDIPGPWYLVEWTTARTPGFNRERDLARVR